MRPHLRLPAVLILTASALCLLPLISMCSDATNFSGLKGTELKESTSLADIARDLLSSKEGQIERAEVIEDRCDSLTVRISYGGLESTESLVLTVHAEDGKHKTIQAISPSKTPLTAGTGEITAKLVLAPNVAGGTKIQQSFLVVTIGKESAIKKAAIKVFVCNKKWEKSLAPEELQISVVAEPIGKSRTLSGSGAPPLVLNPKVFVTKKATLSPVGIRPEPSGTEKKRPVVQAIPIEGAPTPSFRHVAMPVQTPTLAPSLGALRSTNLALGLPKDVKDNNGRGPSANAVRLFDMLSSDVGLTAEDVVDIHPNIYEDANPDSGYFYYLPRGYYLYWDSDTGYALRMLYGASADQSSTNVVSIAARLTSGLDPSDISLVRKLLQKYCESTGHKFRELKPFPFSNISISLKGDLGQYNIPPERISVTGISDIAGMIDISLTTDPVTKENLQMVLTQGLGISGTVTYQSASDAGSGALQVIIPISIKFADRHSFGARNFARGLKFKNASLFPMKLKYLNVLVPGETPTVYSYDLADTQVPAGASATIDGQKIPTWLDSAALKMWVDYAVLADDEEAVAKAIGSVTGGVTSITQSEITFRTLTPLADTGAAVILVTVSSKYFDATASAEVVKTVELTQDSSSFKVGPIYLINRQPGEIKPGDPLFRYKLTVVNPDGTMQEGASWVEANNLTVYIGAAQIRSITGVSETPSPSPEPTQNTQSPASDQQAPIEQPAQ